MAILSVTLETTVIFQTVVVVVFFCFVLCVSEVRREVGWSFVCAGAAHLQHILG